MEGVEGDRGDTPEIFSFLFLCFLIHYFHQYFDLEPQNMVKKYFIFRQKDPRHLHYVINISLIKTTPLLPKLWSTYSVMRNTIL